VSVPYPRTRLEEDELDAPFGGHPANAWGVPARTFIDNALRFLERAFLEYERVPFRTIAVVTPVACVAGDVAYLFGAAQVDGSATIGPKTSAPTPVSIVGVITQSASIGKRVRVIVAGVIPRAVLGLPAGPVRDLGIDAATGRVREALVGDVLVGKIDSAGNALFTGYGLAP
jgi:hypothetical protein